MLFKQAFISATNDCSNLGLSSPIVALNNPAPQVVIKELGIEKSIKPMVSWITANELIKEICHRREIRMHLSMVCPRMGGGGGALGEGQPMGGGIWHPERPQSGKSDSAAILENEGPGKELISGSPLRNTQYSIGWVSHILTSSSFLGEG